MNRKLFESSGKAKAIVLLIGLFLVLLVSYGNNFDNDWHFDDHANITENRNVHLKTLNWEDIRKSFSFQGKISRPMSYLSFALNHYWDDLNVFGYHLVNFAIHFLAAIFLFLLIYRTLSLPSLRDRYGPCALPVAFLATLLWATSPLQVTAVTIIVQRMASMAGLFYLMTMYFYLRGRTARGKIQGYVFFCLAFLAAVLSVGTKENAAIIPVTLFLYELLFFQDLSGENLRKILKWSLVPAVLMAVAAGLYLYTNGILNGYQGRPFTLGERLLTESRILVYYISLLLYPAAERLALLHDIPVSKGLFQPWTTFFSIITILCLIAFSVLMARKRPLVSFCILFFFLNHLIEGSIIPLELIFEHRNYIPSMFFFVLPALAIIRAWEYFKCKPIFRFSLVMLCAFLILGQVYIVHARNYIFRSDFSLWLDNAARYPHLSRVHVHLAKHYAEAGYMKTAFLELSRAYELDNYSSTFQKAEVEYDLGEMWRSVDQDAKAIECYKKALSTYPPYTAPLAGIALIKWKEGKLQEALEMMKNVLIKSPDRPEYHEYAAILLFYLGRYREAEKIATKALLLDDKRLQPLIVRAQISRKEGNYLDAVRIWQIIRKERPESLDTKLALIEIYHELDDAVSLKDMVENVLAETQGQRIENVILQIDHAVMYSAYRPDEKTLIEVFRRYASRANQ